jgi:hypothetical protein
MLKKKEERSPRTTRTTRTIRLNLEPRQTKITRREDEEFKSKVREVLRFVVKLRIAVIRRVALITPADYTLKNEELLW